MSQTQAPRISSQTSPIHGQGAFAEEPIPAGTFIIEYLGERVSRAEAQRRESNNHAMTYLFEYDPDTFIDGASGGNEARFINHSCTPNCVVRREHGRVLIDAGRAIQPGEELSIDYAFDRDDEKVPCRCNSPECRGSLNEL